MYILALGAIALSILGPWIAARIWQGLRSRGFVASRRQTVPTQADKFDRAIRNLKLPPEVEKLRKMGSAMREVIQLSANEAQNKYHESLAHGVSAIALAFIILAAAVVWGPYVPDLVVFSSVVDVACFLWSIIAFWRAAHWNRIWLIRRAKNELIRQWCVLENVFLLGTMDENEVKASYHAFAHRVDVKVGSEPTSFWRTVGTILTFWSKSDDRESNDLVGRILEFWRERREELAMMLKTLPVTIVQYSIYFDKRPYAQAEWFPRARERLARHGRWRARTLLQIFLVTLVVATMKAYLVLGGAHDWHIWKPGLTFIILMLIGVSAAISALYLNQNNRSLAHRYSAQERHIDRWLSRHRPVLEGVASAYAADAVAVATPAGVEASKVPGATESEVAAAQMHAKLRAEDWAALPDDLWPLALVQILEFEDLMIEELLDFISISEHDMLEISAA